MDIVCNFGFKEFKMNIVDIIICIPLAWGLYKGFTKGLVIEIASLASLALAIYGGIKFSDYISTLLVEKFGWQTAFLPLISFVLIFIAIIIVVFTLAKLLERLLKLTALSPVNKLLGAVFGALKFGLIISVLLVIINSIDQKIQIVSDETKEQSLLYAPVLKLSTTLIPALKQGFAEIEKMIEKKK